MSAHVDLLTTHPVADEDLHAALRSSTRGGLLRRTPEPVVAGTLADDVVVDVVVDGDLVMRLVPGHRRTTAAGSRWVLPVALELLDERLTDLGWQVLWRLARRHDGVLLLDGERVEQEGLRDPAPGELDVVGGPPDPPSDAVVVTTAALVLDLPGDPADCWHHVVAAVTDWATDVLGTPAWWDPDGDWEPWTADQPPAPRTWPVGVRLASADGRTTWWLADDRVDVETRAERDVREALRTRLGDLTPWGPRAVELDVDG